MTFKTLVNFRDLGEYKTEDGRHIATGRLLRSGELYDLPAGDIELLRHTYNLKEIVDFRSAEEVSEKPDDYVHDTQYNNIDMFKGDEHEAPALARIERGRGTLSADQRMMLVYEHLVLSSVSQKGFKAFFDVVSNTEEGSVLWHCFAGKDRTGVASALLLHVLGASSATIYDDYMRTIEQRKEANALILANLKAEGADAQKLDDTYTMLNVKKEYLDYAFKLINEHYENIDYYLVHVLGISGKQQQQIRSMYLID